MKTEDLEQKLKRTFSSGFRSPGIFVDTFTEIFTDYPQEKIAVMDESALQSAITNVESRDSVKFMQEWLRMELSAADAYLRDQFLHLFEADLIGAGVLTKRTNLWVKEQFQEYKLTAKNGKELFGHFPIHQDPKSLQFLRDNVTYGDTLEWRRGVGKVLVPLGFNEAEVGKGSLLSVYRRPLDDRVRRHAINSVMDAMSTRYPKEMMGMIKRAAQFFPEIYSNDGSVNFRVAYQLFEWISRGYETLADIAPHSGMDDLFLRTIGEHVHPPLCEVKTRSKQLGRVAIKVIEVYKNLPSKDRQGGPDRSLADISAWRGIMDTPNIYQLVEFWKSNNSSYFELAQFSDGKTVKDYIIEPKKKNGYQSVHILLRLKGEENVHEGQLRTYQMERKAVVGKAAHSGHIGEKLETVADYCSPQEIKFISSALGHTIDPAMLK